MTQMTEPVRFSPISEMKPDDMKCNHSAPKTGWRFVESGSTDPGLIGNLKRDRGIPKPVWPPIGKSNRVDSIVPGKSGQWPSQAHHLIPHKQLTGHPVKIFLKEGTKLISDANYSVNHGNNGKFMPYVSNLEDWTSSNDKQALAARVMSAAGIQLHQGGHSFKSYGGGKVGYKDEVDRLLKRVHFLEIMHQKSCKECRDKSDGSKFPPREQMTRKVDWVSSRLDQEIDANDIFVSRRAYLWWDAMSTIV